MLYTDNPVADFLQYDREQAEEESNLPHCDYCGEAIYESYYNINGEILCSKCLDDNFKYEVEI